MSTALREVFFNPYTQTIVPKREVQRQGVQHPRFYCVIKTNVQEEVPFLVVSNKANFAAVGYVIHFREKAEGKRLPTSSLEWKLLGELNRHFVGGIDPLLGAGEILNAEVYSPPKSEKKDEEKERGVDFKDLLEKVRAAVNESNVAMDHALI